MVVHDVRGRRVRTLVDGFRAAGTHAVVWEGLDDRDGVVASGVYFVRIESAGRAETKKIVFRR
jgi:hypothetical protein